jgi:hypothetical protein
MCFKDNEAKGTPVRDSNLDIDSTRRTFVRDSELKKKKSISHSGYF